MFVELGITFLELLPFCGVKIPSLGGLLGDFDMALIYCLVWWLWLRGDDEWNGE